MHKIAIIKGKKDSICQTEQWFKEEFENQDCQNSEISFIKIYINDYIDMSSYYRLDTQDLMKLFAQRSVPAQIYRKLHQYNVSLWLAEPEEKAYQLAELVNQEIAKPEKQAFAVPRLMRAASINSLIKGLSQLSIQRPWIPGVTHSLGEKDFFETMQSYYHIDMMQSEHSKTLDILLRHHYGSKFQDPQALRVINGYRPGMYASLILTGAQNLQADAILLNLESWTYFVQELQTLIRKHPQLRSDYMLRSLLRLEDEVAINAVPYLRCQGAQSSLLAINVARYHVKRLISNIAIH